MLAAVNNATEKTSPKGAIDQIGECLSRIIYTFAEADPMAKVFMAKWDVKDGFWRTDCTVEEEWNFACVLPQPAGGLIQLVVPTSLQMGWVELPSYFCTATETARDVSTATKYINMPVGMLPPNKSKSMLSARLYCPAQNKHPHNRISLHGRSIRRELHKPCFPYLTKTTPTCPHSRDGGYA